MSCHEKIIQQKHFAERSYYYYYDLAAVRASHEGSKKNLNILQPAPILNCAKGVEQLGFPTKNKLLRYISSNIFFFYSKLFRFLYIECCTTTGQFWGNSRQF